MKINLCTAMPGGSTSFFRTIEPFMKLKKIDPTLQIESIPALDWQLIADCDIVFFERPHNDEFLTAVLATKHTGVKIWVDYDDDLLNIPLDHPETDHFNSEKTKNNIINILGVADIVTVTTEALKETFSKYSNNVYVVENAFDDYMFDLPLTSSSNKCISWRGSSTHEPDLYEYKDAIWNVAAKTEKDYGWLLLGNKLSLFITKPLKNKMEKCLPLVAYYKFVKDCKCAIQIVPLKDNLFNRAKSNIGWLDGLVGGSVCLGPDLPEWQYPGIQRYDSPESFEKGLLELIYNPILREKLYQESRQYVIDNLMLSKVNQKRLDIIKTVSIY